MTDADLGALGQFDLVIAMSVLHHLSDAEADHLFGLAARALDDGGRMFSNDPCFVPGQSSIARAVIQRDRGRNVRSPEGYRALAEARFDDVTDGRATRPPAHPVFTHVDDMRWAEGMTERVTEISAIVPVYRSAPSCLSCTDA